MRVIYADLDNGGEVKARLTDLPCDKWYVVNGSYVLGPFATEPDAADYLRSADPQPQERIVYLRSL